MIVEPLKPLSQKVLWAAQSNFPATVESPVSLADVPPAQRYLGGESPLYMNMGLLPGSVHTLFLLLENSGNNPFSLSQCLGLEREGADD